MKRYQFILLATAACVASFSYGYSVQSECLAPKASKEVIRYVPVYQMPMGKARTVSAMTLSEIMK